MTDTDCGGGGWRCAIHTCCEYYYGQPGVCTPPCPEPGGEDSAPLAAFETATVEAATLKAAAPAEDKTEVRYMTNG